VFCTQCESFFLHLLPSNFNNVNTNWTVFNISIYFDDSRILTYMRFTLGRMTLRDFSLSKRRKRKIEIIKYNNEKARIHVFWLVPYRSAWSTTTIVLPMTCHCHRLRLPINLITTQPFAHQATHFRSLFRVHLSFTLQWQIEFAKHAHTFS